MEKLIEIFTEMLNHIDNHNYAYKKPQWTNRQIVETWVKTNESKLKNIGDMASVSNQRELLIAFLDDINARSYEHIKTDEGKVDAFLSNL
jgi:hypothetical protein